MSGYYSPVFLKQLCHLSLCQPHCLILQPDIYLRLSVLGLIYDDFALFHILLNVESYTP